MDFEGWEACIEAGLDIEKWHRNEYDRQLMAKVIAWYRLHHLVEAHSQDKAIEDQKREARKGRR